MDSNYEKTYHQMEKDHWWFLGRRDILAGFITQTDRKNKILDIGCSGGSFLNRLKELGYTNLHGIDNSPEAVGLCKNNGLANIYEMDGEKTSFADGEFDVIIASDILEHIQNDLAALVEWRRILKPGGKLIIFVPAFQILFSQHDILNRHFRRYSRAGFIKVLKNAGFTVKRCAYWDFSFFPVKILWKLWSNTFKKPASSQKSHLVKIPPLINSFLAKILRFENWLQQFMDFPWGVSIFAIAEK